MTRSMVFCPCDVCQALGISPLRTKDPPEFFPRRCWPNIDPRLVFFFFRAFPKAWIFFFLKRAYRKRLLNIFWRVSLNFKLVVETSLSHWPYIRRFLVMLVSVCVLDIKPLFLPADIQHNQRPRRFFNPRGYTNSSVVTKLRHRDTTLPHIYVCSKHSSGQCNAMPSYY